MTFRYSYDIEVDVLKDSIVIYQRHHSGKIEAETYSREFINKALNHSHPNQLFFNGVNLGVLRWVSSTCIPYFDYIEFTNRSQNEELKSLKELYGGGPNV